jgi:hypothetical protein
VGSIEPTDNANTAKALKEKADAHSRLIWDLLDKEE